VRVASLTPSNTEIVAFLGRAGDLVAVDTWSDWPPGLEAEDLGPDLQIDVERLAALEPDLVLASESVPGMERVVERIEAAGLDPLVLAPTSLAEVRADVRRVGESLGAVERGVRVAEAMREELERLRSATVDAEGPSVHWEWWPDPTIVAGRGGWMPEVLEAAGAGNAYDRGEQSFEATAEEVRQAAPEVVGLCWQGALHAKQSVDRALKRAALRQTPAGRRRRVLEAPEHLFGRPGPRLVEGVRWLAEQLHPDRREELGAPYAWVPDPVAEELDLGSA